MSYGTYHGGTYSLPSSTVGDPRCRLESKWMKIMQHSVRIGEDTIIDDWLFVDHHDRINVLVQDPKDSESFLIFRQTKYAFEGKDSLAVIGGLIEPGETAEITAQREIYEELDGMICYNYIKLGRFRTVQMSIVVLDGFMATWLPIAITKKIMKQRKRRVKMKMNMKKLELQIPNVRTKYQ